MMPVMSDQEFACFGGFIQTECGIKLPTTKKAMLASRLQRRLKALGFTSFGQYYDHIFDSNGKYEEIIHMFEAVTSITTNKTEFFRESKHFDFLLAEGLKAFVERRPIGFRKKLNFWSAGCSSGEEPYSLAMIMSEFVSQNPALDFSILSSDLSSRMLAAAVKAIYPEQVIISVPAELRKKYLMRGGESQKGFYRIVPELRRRVSFRRINLMDNDYGIQRPIHVLFCRNVIIYFDKETQKHLFRKLFACLVPGGYLFVGHTETLDGVSKQFVRVAPAIYRKPMMN
jgi:chemotaxis protein methyltransferase CheR